MSQIYHPYYATQVANSLLDVHVFGIDAKSPVMFNDGFPSPFYSDNRRLQSYPNERSFIAGGIARIVKEKFPEAEAIASIANGAITHGILASDNPLLRLPHLTINKEIKTHGRQRIIEGDYKEGQKIVVFEDLISTAKSAEEGIRKARKAKLNVIGVVSIMTYNFPQAEKTIKKFGVPVYTLTNFPTVIKQAELRQEFTENQLNTTKQWYKNPKQWQPQAA
jgi:orotate phosphoribosyltransferase